MIKYIGGRLILLIPVILGITVITFVLSSFSAGDPAFILAENLYNHPTIEQVEQVRHEAGLDRPLYVQYGTWLNKVVHGDRSLRTNIAFRNYRPCSSNSGIVSFGCFLCRI